MSCRSTQPAFKKKIKIEIESSPWIQSVCVFAWILFLFLWCLPKTPVSAIPPVLFLVILCCDWAGIKLLIRQYRLEISLIFGALVLGILLSPLPQKSAKGAYDFIRGGLVFFPTILLARARPDLFRAFFPWALGLACLIFSAGALDVVIDAVDDPMRQRALLEAYFGNQNHFGTGTAMVGLLALASLWVYSMHWRMRLYLYIIVGVSLGLTLFSGSRGSVLAFIVALIFLVFVSLRQFRWWVLSGGGLLLAGFLGVLFFDLLPGVDGGWRRPGDFSAGRIGLYVAILSQTWNEAKFFGFGINTFKYLNVGQVLPSQTIMPHSWLVELFFSLGLVGSAVFFAAFARLGLRIQRGGGGLAVIGGCVLVFILVRGAIDLKLWSVYFPALLGSGLGLLLAPSALTISLPEERSCSDSIIHNNQPILGTLTNRTSHE